MGELPQFDLDLIPEQAQITRRLVEQLNDAVDVNDALIAVVQAFMDLEAPVAAFMTWLDEQSAQAG